jgi:hypothetical protein
MILVCDCYLNHRSLPRTGVPQLLFVSKLISFGLGPIFLLVF